MRRRTNIMMRVRRATPPTTVPAMVGAFVLVAGVGGGGFVVAGSGGTSARLVPFEGVWLRSLE